MKGFTNEWLKTKLNPVAGGLPYPIPKRCGGGRTLAIPEYQEASPASVTVRITRFASRMLDKDNLYGGAKPICDALRYAGYIKDDDPNSIELIVRQSKCTRKQVGTLIEILTTGKDLT